MSLLKAIDIHKSYGQLAVLKGVSVQLQEGEVVALVGASGAGKSTLLQIMGTLDEADGGSIYFGTKNITMMNERQRAQFRNESLGFVFQFHHLLPEFTALENACMPAWIAGRTGPEVTDRATELLTRLGLAERTHHKPNELSGGEKQRVAIARALINSPKLILADEPTGNLDTRNSDELIQLIFDLARSLGVSFLIATHNLGLAEQADRICHIKDGVMG
ncbi:MAG: ABC transporter ATP-binding protein [Bacteroidetes bacterium]|nr:MAG: ABC transporter ATP-binding protein [Bacteroidota bacterium]